MTKGGILLQPKISVIVPVYNVANYLHRCLDSIINQTYKNLEIILIDDGSTDGSADICEWYAKKDTRILILHEENTGATKARKKGIVKSSGDYIGFVDSDDWLERDAFAHMMEKMLLHKVDFVLVRHTIEYDNQSILTERSIEGVYTRYAKDKEKCTYHHMFPWDKDNKMKMTTLLWDKLFRREVIEKYYMCVPDTIIYAEDSVCIYSCLPYVNSIYVSNQYCYHYNQQNVLSVSKTLGTEHSRVADATRLYTHLYECYKTHEAKSEILEQLYIYAMKLMLLVSPMPQEKSIIAYTFPYEHIMSHKKIIIYGAGKVGISYYKQLKRISHFEIVSVIDKNTSGSQFLDTTIDSITAVQEKQYDIIVIAVDKKNLADAIVDELTTTYTVPKEKMIWEKPQHIFEQ